MCRYVAHVAELDAIEDVQRAFLDWIHDFGAVDDAARLLSLLTDCHEPLPAEYCQSLGLPAGSSFGDAARLLGGPWGLA